MKPTFRLIPQFQKGAAPRTVRHGTYLPKKALRGVHETRGTKQGILNSPGGPDAVETGVCGTLLGNRTILTQVSTSSNSLQPDVHNQIVFPCFSISLFFNSFILSLFYPFLISGLIPGTLQVFSSIPRLVAPPTESVFMPVIKNLTRAQSLARYWTPDRNQMSCRGRDDQQGQKQPSPTKKIQNFSKTSNL